MTRSDRESGGRRAPQRCVDPEIGVELDRLDDEGLDEATRARIEHHVAECEACGDELQLRLEVGHALGRMEEQGRASPRRGRLWRYALTGAAAALALAALILVPWTWWSPQLDELRLESVTRSSGSVPSVRPGESLRLQLELTVGRAGDTRDLVLLGPDGRRIASASRRVQAPPPRVEWELPQELPRAGRYTVRVTGPEGNPLAEESFSFVVTGRE
jgi:hypothetical protein